jgi:hypothetical protein
MVMGAPKKKDRKVILYRFVDDLRFYLFEGFFGEKNTKCRIGSRRNLQETWKILILWFPVSLPISQPSDLRS